ncbi:hypothetical protein LOZ65_000456 [Ophidiomyces ophidiicola]|nr:hypothetical protein LOZ65_000456 [Ophidiomyces ophidiicola]
MDPLAIYSNNSGQSVPSAPPPQLWMSPPSFHSRRVDHPLDEPTLAQRTATFRQLNRLPQTPRRIPRQTAYTGSQQYFPSQPVVIRTFSADTNVRGTMSRHSNHECYRPAKLPPVQDFGIEGILQAIEPDIRNTLDTIAEICGRSKLSLANEYGSHRPPLGEIRAISRPMDHTLLAVEEASSSNERLADENIMILGDDLSTLDGRDAPSARYRLFEHLPETVITTDRDSYLASRNDVTASTTEVGDALSTGESRPQPHSYPQEGNSRPSSFPWAFLGKDSGFERRVHPQPIQTRPVVSEIHLDVNASRPCQQASLPQQLGSPGDRNPINTKKLGLAENHSSFFSDLGNLFGWLKQNSDIKANNMNQRYVTAENKLRDALLK